MKFLTARWEHLLLANYQIDPQVLAPLVPAHTTIDRFEGSVFVSLVAFMFTRTRVLGLPIPWHTCFEEVNLRFYIVPDYDPSRRAVAFIKEIVPKAAIPPIANTFFCENYVALPMNHETQSDTGRFAYSWHSGSEHSFSAWISGNVAVPPARSVAEFITEHYWGYAKGTRSTLEYQVPASTVGVQ